MKDFLNFIEAHWPTIVAAASSVASWVVSLVMLVKSHSMKAALNQAKARETVAECPYCHRKAPLSEVHFYLPGGAKDDDLNGLPD